MTKGSNELLPGGNEGDDQYCSYEREKNYKFEEDWLTYLPVRRKQNSQFVICQFVKKVRGFPKQKAS